VDVVTTADVEVVRTAAFNDRSAVGFMFELRRAGVGIPGDISVVGYDDITMAALPFIDLTTVGQDRHRHRPTRLRARLRTSRREHPRRK
jgi:DNA-binding LacI/PurR family transcriptional regulator